MKVQLALILAISFSFAHAFATHVSIHFIFFHIVRLVLWWASWASRSLMVTTQADHSSNQTTSNGVHIIWTLIVMIIASTSILVSIFHSFFTIDIGLNSQEQGLLYFIFKKHYIHLSITHLFQRVAVIPYDAPMSEIDNILFNLNGFSFEYY